MDLVPFHATLSPAAADRGSDVAAAATTAAAAAATAVAAAVVSVSQAAAAAARSRRRHRVFQHEAVPVRGHDHRRDGEFQEESADQPLPIKIQNQQTADNQRDHQRPGLPVRLQRGVQVRARDRQQAQVQVHEHDGARTKAQAAVAPVDQHGQHRRGQAHRRQAAQAVFAAGRR